MLTRKTLPTLALALLLAALSAHAQVDAPQQRLSIPSASPGGVYRARVVPHWLPGNTRFWYRNDLRDGKREFILVDASAATRKHAFDHERLAHALADATHKSIDGERLPIDAIDFTTDGKSLRFSFNNTPWTCDLITYTLAPATTQPAATQKTEAPVPLELEAQPLAASPQAADSQPATQATQPTTRPGRGAFARGPRNRFRPNADTMPSPDGRSAATVRNNNLVLLSDGKETPLTTDGTAAFAYTRPFWSPDGKYLVTFRMENGDRKDVYRIESSPSRPPLTGGGTGRTVLQTQAYALPGDKFDSYELHLIDPATGKNLKPDLDRIDMHPGGWDPSPTVRWLPDNRHFTYEKFDRGHQRVRIIEVDAATGASRNILDEQSKTFIWSAHAEAINARLITYLRNPYEILYLSEMDGWRHLYLIDGHTGSLKQITKGPWVVRGIHSIDEDAREIWFSASGIYPNQDPYLLHYGRIKFDGTGLTWLTDADGNHTINFEGAATSFSPDDKYVIDSYSRVDLAPVTELRRCSDGKLVVPLEKAEVPDSWEPPTVFAAKGRDGTTDIWGILLFPTNYDPAKKYPVIEDIYAGPQDSFVPKSFSPGSRYRDLRNLGFFVVKIDGMGTANRSKAFHDVIWHNLKDGGFFDRIAWMKAAAQKFPAMDLTRVGVYGTSAGGQNAAAAVLFHPEFYKVAVANCGCHDNRMDKASWNEQWMGYPVGPWYGECSNIDNAWRLQGKLQLVVGELDSNVPPESTYRFVDALIKARKDFEFVLVPGANHGTRDSATASAFSTAKLQDFFVKNLQGIDPPNRNAKKAD